MGNIIGMANIRTTDLGNSQEVVRARRWTTISTTLLTIVIRAKNIRLSGNKEPRVYEPGPRWIEGDKKSNFWSSRWWLKAGDHVPKCMWGLDMGSKRMTWLLALAEKDLRKHILSATFREANKSSPIHGAKPWTSGGSHSSLPSQTGTWWP